MDAASAGPWLTDYQGRELDFIRDHLGARSANPAATDHGSTLWEFPRLFVEKLFSHRRVAVTSSRSTAKTYTAGQIAAAFLLTAPGRVLVIAPTMRQATKGVMSEMRAAIGKMPQPMKFAVNNPAEVRIDDRHWAMCLPSRDPDAMRGFHAGPAIPADPDDGYMSESDIALIQEMAGDDSTRFLLVLDEAASIKADAFRVLRGMMTKPHVYVILTGNPTLGVDDDHDYVRAFADQSRYYRIRVSSIPADEFPAPSGVTYDRVFDHVPEYLVSAEEIAAARSEMSADDPILIADWAGTFATGSSGWIAVPRSAFEAAVGSNFANVRPLGLRMGVDIGTGNPDQCVAVLYWDGIKIAQHSWAPHSDDMAGQVSIADTIMGLAAKWGEECGKAQHPAGPSFRFGSSWDGSPIPAAQVSIDDSGLVGVGDIMSSREFHCDRVNFASKAGGQWRDLVGRARFTNVRTEMHWVARRGLQEGVFVIPPQWRASWQEGPWTRFGRKYDSRGAVIFLEPKEKVRARNQGKSPDTWDADILAMRQPLEMSQMFGQTGPLIQPPEPAASRRRRTRLPGARKIQ